jgi:hypothetical protein
MNSIEGYKGDLSSGIAIESLQEVPQDGDWFEVEGTCDVNELDRAQAPFSAFVFRDERLRPLEARGDVRLRQAALLAKVTQQLAELDLARRAQRVAHCRKPGSNMTASPHNPDFGLSHFGIFVWRLRLTAGIECNDRNGATAFL